MAYTTDATRWRALVTRDANANGHFIYSVRSTNIYCRPTCPGRLARRANVGFYKTFFEAEAAGFRACKRCKPNTVLEDPQERAVERACKFIEEALEKNNPKAFRLQDLAKNVGLTPRYFHKIFKDKTGLTPKEYAKTRSTGHNSPSTSPMSTGTEASVNMLEWDNFDFNDLVDFGVDSDSTLSGNFATEAGQISAAAFGIGIDVNVRHQPWSAGYDLNGVDSGFILLDDQLLDPLVATATSFALQQGKSMPTVSTFELDAAALLGTDSLTGMFPT